MDDITKNEMKAVLKILKSPEVMYNANNLAKEIDITSMGTLKILKRLEKEGILISREIGKAKIYHINVENDYARRYVSVILTRERIQSSALIRRWVKEIRKIKRAEMIMLFGSVLTSKNPNDIDVLLVTDQRRFTKVQEEIKELNKLNVKKIHPVYQSRQDIVKNIKERDGALLNAIKGIIVRGEEMILEVYNESR